MRNAIVIVVEGLRPEYLGPYGNAWVFTPHLNRLAAEGFVFDHCVAAEKSVSLLFRSLLTGRHPSLLERQGWKDWDGTTAVVPLLQTVRAREGTGLFVTDDPRLFQDPAAQSFDAVELVSGRRIEAGRADSWDAIMAGLPPTPCSDWSETWTAGFFSQVTDMLANLKDRPFFLWCHFGGFSRIWDCPTEFRERYQEEGDPPPWNGVSAPRHYFPPGADPDAWLPFVQAYAGQVVLLDLCLGGLFQAIALSGLEQQSVLALAGFGGFPLAEHGWLGMWKMPPRNERIGCPLLLRFPNREAAADRSHALCYVHDLAPTLIEAISDPAALSPETKPHTAQTTDVSAIDCGSDVPLPSIPEADGRSLMPIIRGAVEGVRDRLFCYCDEPAAVGVRTPSWFALVDLSLELPPFHQQPSQAALTSREPSEGLRESLGSELPQRTASGGDCEKDSDSPQLPDVATVRRIAELYVKPDDRWEMNDVADRCPETAVAAIRQAAAFRHLVRGELSALPPSDPTLLERLS